MKKLRGMLGALALLTLGLAGCQAVANDSFKTTDTVQNVQSAAPGVTAVSKIRTTDYLGRWVNQAQGVAIYLDTNQNLALFQTNHATIKGHYTLKLGDNYQATLNQAKLGTAQLTLSNATTMTLKRGQTTFKLTKDTGWSPEHGEIPTDAKTALKASTLATPTPLKPAY
ncbi:hypothetical protein [Lactiplantibacillus daowaiensis]|uniref:Lipoprotein n=1 Tax=Lactiplantibacillus daowaiensis TaxID=2559918 RepID=A0ABW1S1H2_9LACO|nr:hypothetical protein [Lactiplantibacillus daowaiensis]